MSLLTISCYVYGSSYRIFNIQTDRNTQYSALQNQILERRKNWFAGLGEDDLVLWKAPFDHDNGSVDNITLGSGVGGATELSPQAIVKSVFPSKDVKNHLLVIQRPPKLFCWVYGLPEDSIFELQLCFGDHVSDLKKRIKEQNSDMFDFYAERDITLWKVPFNNNNDSVNDIKLENGLGGVVELTANARVRSVFPSTDANNHLLVIQLPPKLSCWVHGLPKEKRFELQRRFSDHVSDLKARIQEQKRDMFDKYEERDIALWKVPFNNDNDSVNDIKLEDGVGGVVELTAESDARVHSVFPSKDVNNHLLVIQLPPKLSCWVYGQPKDSIFELQLCFGDHVSDLKKRIKEQNSDLFDFYAERDITLWKVPFNKDNDSVNDIKLENGLGGVVELTADARVRSVFPSTDANNHLLVIQLPPKLSCWVHGLPKEKRFELQRRFSDHVSDLKARIQEQKRDMFDKYEERDIALWKAPFNNDKNSVNDIKLEDGVGGVVELTAESDARVRSIFPSKDVNNHLLVIQLPPKLSCWVYGQPEGSTFELQLCFGDHVSDVKKRIKEQNSDMFGFYVERDIALWKVPFNEDKDSVDDIKLVHRVNGPIKLLSRRALVSSVFPSKDVDNHLLVIHLPPKLLYCALGQSKEARFELQPHSDDNVGRLKEMIKEASRPYFDSVPTSHLILWKVEIDLKTQDIPANLQGMPAGARKLQHEEKIESIFLEPVQDDRLSIVVDVLGNPFGIGYQAKETNRGNVEDLITNFEKALQTISKAVPPSESAKSSEYPKSQVAYCIYDGRYGVKHPRSTISLPVRLFNPVFDHFLDGLGKESEIPQDFARKVAKYMTAASAVYRSEDTRRDALMKPLGELLGVKIELISSTDNTRPDGVVKITTPSDHDAVILLKEDKNEFGDGNSDPSTQVGLSMARFWTQSKFKAVRNNTCCPTFLVANAGPWIAVLGAVFTDIVIIQRLTDYLWIGEDCVLSKEHHARVTRVLYSLKGVLSQLQNYYDGLDLSVTDKTLGPRFFPSINKYRDNESGDLIQFKYTGFLENNTSCVTLLAETLGECKKIVVKFTDRYGEAPHQYLASANRAPQLYYFGSPCEDSQGPPYKGIFMVVMEYIDGKIVDKAEIGFEKVKKELEESLAILHERNLVFGDLRIPNVMVTKEGRVKLVDFDWGGIEGQTRYPHVMSTNIQWAEGAEECSLIKKEHDVEMMKTLLGELTHLMS